MMNKIRIFLFFIFTYSLFSLTTSCKQYICPLQNGKLRCPPKTYVLDGYDVIFSKSNAVKSASDGVLGEFSLDSTYNKTRLVVFSGKHLEKRFVYLLDSVIVNPKTKVKQGEILGFIKPDEYFRSVLYFKIKDKFKAYETKSYKRLKCECGNW